METILRLLPALACPIVMGLLVWMLSRNNNANANNTTLIVQEPRRISSTSTSPFRAVVDMIKCCFNPKVIAGLAVVGVGMLVFAPRLAASALPVLVVLACPLSMMFMMRGMNRGMTNGQMPSAAPQPEPARQPIIIDQDRKETSMT